MNSNDVLINNLINSNKSYNIRNEITKNNSKLFNNLFIDYSKMRQLNTIECSNINYSDRLRYNTIEQDKNIRKKINYINESTNIINEIRCPINYPNKKLTILKEGLIFWLRKLYIILPDGTNRNYNQNLFMYFYFPIKDINMKMERKCSYREEGGEIFCKTIENILEQVRLFLKLPNLYDYFKYTLYNEDYVIIKNDNQLMEKKNKYKILYVKIKRLSNEQIKKKIKRCQFHRHHRKSCDFILKTVEKPIKFFKTNEVKNQIFLDKLFTTSNKNRNIINKKISVIKTEDDKNGNITQNEKTILNSNDLFKNINRNNKVLLDKNRPSFLKNIININSMSNINNNKNFNRNNTDAKFFPKLFFQQFKSIDLYNKNEYIISNVNSPIQKSNLKDLYNIPKIKSKGLWISCSREKYNILPTKLSQKNIDLNNNKTINNNNDSKSNINEDSDNIIYSISIEQSHNNSDEIYDKTKINNDYIKNILNNSHNKSINLENESCEKKTFKKQFILKESLSEGDPCDDVFNITFKNINEIIEKKNPINKSKRNNNSFSNYNKNKHINNFIEINQIQFIALNNCIRNFIAEKIDSYIDDIEIQTLFNREIILKNIKEINSEIPIPINIYLKEFLLFSYLSNNICKNHIQFCVNLFEELKDYYININNILSIKIFKEFIFSLKNIFHEIKSNKLTMKKRLKNNYNNLKISFVLFILFMIYNKKNLSTFFDKDILFGILECIDIHFPEEINVEQFIKFKLFFTKNKWIKKEMKKQCITKFFNKYIINNKNLDIDLIIIKLRPIIKINAEDIKQIKENNKDFNNNIDIIYDKFIDYFNF